MTLKETLAHLYKAQQRRSVNTLEPYQDLWRSYSAASAERSFLKSVS